AGWRVRLLLALRNRATVQALRDDTADAGLDLHVLHTQDFAYGRDDLSQVVHVPASVVLRHVDHDEHSMRGVGQAARARAWRHVQDRVAHVQPDSYPADGAGLYGAAVGQGRG